jgi:hypothetical protein
MHLITSEWAYALPVVWKSVRGIGDAKKKIRGIKELYPLANALASTLANAVIVDLLHKRINYSWQAGSLQGNRTPSFRIRILLNSSISRGLMPLIS